MIIELRHLRSLKAIEETGSLAQAALRLHLTQSALSHQIKTVENYFEVSLYERKHKPLRLTSAGQRLLNLAQKILPEVEAAEFEIKHIAGQESGRLHITIECHSCFEWLIPTLDYYRKRWPDVEVDIRLGNSFEPIKALSDGGIDLVITTDQVAQGEISFEPLFEYQALVAIANDHSLVSKTCWEAVDFVDETLITYPVKQERLDIFSRFLNPQQVSPKKIRQCELTVMILQLVASRRGVAVLPDWVLDDYIAKKYITARPIGKSGMKGMLYAAVRKQEITQDYIKDFIELAREGLYLRKTSVN